MNLGTREAPWSLLRGVLRRPGLKLLLKSWLVPDLP